MSTQTKLTKDRRGIAVLEFTFSLLFLIPLLLGVFVFGFKLIRSLEMTQVTRDLGAMYLRGVDFRGTGAQQTATTLAADYNLTATGTSIVILSRVRIITSSDCIAANNVPPIVAGSSCTNLGKIVFTEQLTIGNTSVGSSQFGTPPVQSTSCTPLSPGTPCSYTVTISDLGRNSAAQANNFPMTLNAGEVAYVAEFVNQTPELNIPGLTGAPLIYSRAIF
jgi:hypothetical protein